MRQRGGEVIAPEFAHLPDTPIASTFLAADDANVVVFRKVGCAMDEAKHEILGQQVDALAERVTRLDEELKELRKILSRPDVLERLGLDKSAFDPFMAKFKASNVRITHELDRHDAIKAARREKLLQRLERADDLAKLIE
jgi:hypothetical protein